MIDTTIIDPEHQAVYDKNLVTRMNAYLVHELFGQRRPLVKHGGAMTIKCRLFNTMSPATTPLTEGVVPAGGTASKTDFLIPCHPYGDYLKVTEEVDYFNISPVLLELGKVLAKQARETRDLIIRDQIVGGTMVRRAGGVASRGAIVTKMTTTDLKAVERAMLGNDAEYFDDMVKASEGYATSPTRAAFFVIVHSDCKTDIEDFTNFISVEKYNSQTTTYPSEFGAWGNFRFLLTSKAKIWPDEGGDATAASLKYTTASSHCDVYSALVFSPDAYGVSDLAGEGIRNIIKPKESGGPENPLEQFGTTGWKMYLGAATFQDERMYRIEFGVSA